MSQYWLCDHGQIYNTKEEADAEQSQSSLTHVIEYKAFLELIEAIELYDAYPDLSGHKYVTAYNLLRQKLNEIKQRENVDELRYGKQPEVEYKKFDDNF